ncbi:MAG: hypothetical protein D6722_04035, partial [Bacteroidetes bacterium]
SLYERHTDELDGHTSFVRAIGPRGARWLVTGLGGMVLGVGALRWVRAPETWPIQGIYLLMTLTLLLILWREDWFRPADRYRSWGDAVFWLPALALLGN